MKNTCVDLLIKAHKKLNYIEDFRRIVLVIIGIGVLCALFVYLLNGCIFDSSNFENNVYMKSSKTNNEITIREFKNKYVDSENYYSGIKCFPYKQECKIGNFDISIRAKDVLELQNSTTKEKINIEIKMPSRIQYFTWQVLDLLLIFGLAFLAWALYLAIEMILVWIFAGFKSDKSNNGK